MVRSDHRSHLSGVGVDPAEHPVRVAIADRRRLIAEALAALIAGRQGFTVTGAVAGDSAVSAIAAQRPDLVVVGVGSDSRREMQLVRDLRRRVPGMGIVILADSLEPSLVKFVLDEGIGGLLLTDAAGREILACLDRVVPTGGAVLPARLAGACCTRIATIRSTRSASGRCRQADAPRRRLLLRGDRRPAAIRN